MSSNHKFIRLYETLLSAYGCQGWWPLTASSDPVSLTKGYHPQDYSVPKTDRERLEISLGAILTQNTNWKNVPPALRSLEEKDLFSVDKLINAEINQIALAIKRCGYYNQKAIYLKHLANFFKDHPFSELVQGQKNEIRGKLLKIKGIGPETADCIMLYALKKISFVIDAYTTRIFSTLGWIEEGMGYHKLKNRIETELEQDLVLYQEFHALLVQHGKLYYSRKPYGSGDPLLSL
jgi:endonuclease III related protein